MIAPADGFRVRLPVFSGPMDLLLHLVREKEVEIEGIPIGPIAEGFLAHVRAMASLDMEVASEFLVLAATLMEIKVRLLLPRPEGEALEEDPRWELVQKLLEYRRFKDAASFLEGRGELMSRRWARSPEPPPALEEEAGPPELQNPWGLFQSHARLMEQLAPPRTATLRATEVPLEQLRGELLALCPPGGALQLSFREVYAERKDRGRIVGLFLAVLELARLGLLAVRQEGLFGALRCERAAPPPASS